MELWPKSFPGLQRCKRTRRRGVQGSKNLAPSIFTHYDLKPTGICNNINFDKQIRRADKWAWTNRARFKGGQWGSGPRPPTSRCPPTKPSYFITRSISTHDSCIQLTVLNHCGAYFQPTRMQLPDVSSGVIYKKFYRAGSSFLIDVSLRGRPTQVGYPLASPSPSPRQLAKFSGGIMPLTNLKLLVSHLVTLK